MSAALAFALGYSQDAADPLALEAEFRAWRADRGMEPTRADRRRLMRWEVLFARRWGVQVAAPEVLR